MKVRTRYAPSPTGYLHIGNARTALFTYLYAKHYGGDFIIRIEDTDTLRNIADGEMSQFKYLKWLGLDWQESPIDGGPYGPYRQLERLDIYQKYANELLDKGYAYKEYRDNSEEFAIRFRVPENKTYTFNDIVRGELTFQSKEVEDWIIMKDNGIPTYNFAVVIDDHLMAITHVLRGEEHITNTPKQMMIYETFGWDIPTFGHMTIIVNEQRKKLSKRDKDVLQFISEYEEAGYLPGAMFNFISLLGFSPEGDEEILSKDEIIKIFNPNRLSKSPAMFDKVKLAYINSRYIKALSDEELKELVRPFLVKANIEIVNDDWLLSLVQLFKDRMHYLGEIVSLYQKFFSDDFILTAEVLELLKEFDSLELLENFLEKLTNLDDFKNEEINNIIKDSGKEANKKGKALFQPTRIAVTGEISGPSLPASMELLGKELVLTRIKKTIEVLRGAL